MLHQDSDLSRFRVLSADRAVRANGMYSTRHVSILHGHRHGSTADAHTKG
jgi:hypothetical protein